MEISGISSSDPSQAGASIVESPELDREAFMQLLVTQMKNQDPLKPTANEDFIAQLASFSSLEQMELLNDNILGMAILQQGNALMEQLTQSSALIGKQVTYYDPTTDSEKSGQVDSVKVVDGQAVLNVDGADVLLGNVSEVTNPPTADDAGDE